MGLWRELVWPSQVLLSSFFNIIPVPVADLLLLDANEKTRVPLFTKNAKIRAKGPSNSIVSAIHVKNISVR